MGQSRWIDDDQNQRKRTPSFPSHESIVSRNAKKQRRWKIIFTLLCRWGYDWNCFSNSYFCQLSIYGAVSDLCDEYRICQTRTVKPVLAGQSDPLFPPANLMVMTPRPSTEIPAQENLLQKYEERVERLPQQERVIKICIDAGFLTTVAVLHDKRHWRVLTIYRTSGMSWVNFATRWKINWPERLDSREDQNWTRVRNHNQLLAR